MSTYYFHDGILYTTKTLCNLRTTWQKECIVYPDEAKRLGRRQHRRTLQPWESLHSVSLIDWAAM